MAGYLDAVDAARPAVNVAALVPLRHAPADRDGRRRRAHDRGGPGRDRAAARGRRSTPARPGCRPGSSTRSRAWPPPPSSRRCAGSPAGATGCTPCHTRNKDVRAVEAVDEAIATAERAGVRLQVSHLVPRPGRSRRRPRAIDRAHRPRRPSAGSTSPSTSTPGCSGSPTSPWRSPAGSIDGGPDGDPRRCCATGATSWPGTAASSTASGCRGWDGVFITDAPATPEVAGRSLAELAAEAGRPARDVVFDVLAAHADRVDEPMAIGWSYTVDQIAEAAAHPRCSPELGRHDPQPGRAARPATSSTAPTPGPPGTSRRSSRERRSAAARGRRPPADRACPPRGSGWPTGASCASARGPTWPCSTPADVRATGTFEEPNRLATGMRHVVVNGVFGLEDGRLTGRRGGRALRAGAA